MPRIARVEPLTTARALSGPFDYSLPDGHDVGDGALLRVPFGRRELTAVVTALADETDVPADKLFAPRTALPVDIGPELVALARWIAVQYCSTTARALALMLPPGAQHRQAAPRERLFATLTPAGADALDDHATRLTANQRETLTRLRHGALPATEAANGHDSLRRLERRGLIALGPPPRAEARGPVGTPPTLTAEQRVAAAEIDAALHSREPHALLLHGVTGSGKTEVYLRAAATALAQGRSVIVLVPEIALTAQTQRRFIDRLGDTVAVVHSGMTDGERAREWHRMRAGEARVCIGPRSAVFAPVQSLGLIVIDEEHDSSYKHEGDPRYDARTVAARRTRDAGAVLLCGSATPRPESHHALRTLHLRERVDGRPLPEVQVVDMRGVDGPLHPASQQALAEVRRAGGKAIVLLNRRGWSNFLDCRACGHVWSCPHCDVSLVLHRARGRLECHHCGHVEPVAERCPECGSSSVARHGLGTERLEQELERLLGGDGFPIVRVDADVRGSVHDRLQRFADAPAGVLVGTQTVAKGHDFPDVGLALVIDADATLRFPDFRAEERTFALLCQLAGRAGRGGHGRVLVQTMDPDARAFREASRHDSDAFLETELERRRALGYPPFAHLIRIVCASPREGAAQRAATAIAGRLDARAGTVLGPAPLFRLRGRERCQILCKMSDRATAAAAVGEAVRVVAASPDGRHVTFSVDVDPL